MIKKLDVLKCIGKYPGHQITFLHNRYKFYNQCSKWGWYLRLLSYRKQGFVTCKPKKVRGKLTMRKGRWYLTSKGAAKIMFLDPPKSFYDNRSYRTKKPISLQSKKKDKKKGFGVGFGSGYRDVPGGLEDVVNFQKETNKRIIKFLTS